MGDRDWARRSFPLVTAKGSAIAPSKLAPYQQRKLIEMLAAGHPTQVILDYFASQGWPAVSQETIYYYRTTKVRLVHQAVERRLSTAVAEGLATKQKRLAMLQDLADGIAPYLYAQEKGRLVNVGLMLQILDDFAKEVGGRIALPQPPPTNQLNVYLANPADVQGILQELSGWREGRFPKTAQEAPDDEH